MMMVSYYIINSAHHFVVKCKVTEVTKSDLRNRLSNSKRTDKAIRASSSYNKCYSVDLINTQS